MASKKESPEATWAKKNLASVDEEGPKAVAASVPKEKTIEEPKKDYKPITPTLPLIPFARWFSAKGFKPHWKLGMEAFADTTGKRTMEEWDQIFKNY